MKQEPASRTRGKLLLVSKRLKHSWPAALILSTQPRLKHLMMPFNPLAWAAIRSFHHFNFPLPLPSAQSSFRRLSGTAFLHPSIAISLCSLLGSLQVFHSGTCSL